MDGFNVKTPEATTVSPSPQPQINQTNMVDQPSFPDGYFNASPYGKPLDRQPNAHIAKMLWDTFPKDATKSAIAARTESGYDPKAKNVNRNGSVDLGLMQINDGTFNDYMKRMPNKLRNAGISSFDDMLDAQKNLNMAKIIQSHQGWDAWYGPKDKGYDL